VWGINHQKNWTRPELARRRGKKTPDFERWRRRGEGFGDAAKKRKPKSFFTQQENHEGGKKKRGEKPSCDVPPLGRGKGETKQVGIIYHLLRFQAWLGGGGKGKKSPPPVSLKKKKRISAIATNYDIVSMPGQIGKGKEKGRGRWNLAFHLPGKRKRGDTGFERKISLSPVATRRGKKKKGSLTNGPFKERRKKHRGALVGGGRKEGKAARFAGTA